MSRQDQIIALIRTGVPALIGAFLSFLTARIPAVAFGIEWVDSQLQAWGFAGVSVSIALSAAMVGLAVTGYYWLARQIGARWPASEKWLLGRSAVPTYTPKKVVPFSPVVTSTAAGATPVYPQGTVNAPKDGA